MNGLVPALLAVALAEFGPRAMIYAEARRVQASLWLIAACIVASAVAGALVAPMLTEWADALMIGIALAFAALAQIQRIRPAAGLLPVIATFWRGGTTLLIFALTARFGPLPVIAGALAGLVAATLATRAVRQSSLPEGPFRWACAIVLAIAGFVSAVQGLRLT